MANLLQDIGRSNVSQVGQGIFRNILAVGDQERQGYLGMLTAQDHQRKTEILNAENDRRALEHAQKQEQYVKDQEWKKTPFNVRFSPLLSLHTESPDYQERVETIGKLAGADEAGNTTNEGMARAAAVIKGNPELAKKWFEPRLKDLESRILKNDDALYDAQLAGDETKINKLTGIGKNLKTQYMMKKGEYATMIKGGDKEAIAERRIEAIERAADERERAAGVKEDQMDRKLDLMEKDKGTGSKNTEKEFQYEDRKAKESLAEDGIKSPTVKQIAERREILFPRGVTKPAGRDPRAELSGDTSDSKTIDGKKYKKINGKWYQE